MSWRGYFWGTSTISMLNKKSCKLRSVTRNIFVLCWVLFSLINVFTTIRIRMIWYGSKSIPTFDTDPQQCNTAGKIENLCKEDKMGGGGEGGDEQILFSHLWTSTLALDSWVMFLMVAPPRPMMAPTMSLETRTRSGKSTPRGGRPRLVRWPASRSSGGGPAATAAAAAAASSLGREPPAPSLRSILLQFNCQLITFKNKCCGFKSPTRLAIGTISIL